MTTSLVSLLDFAGTFAFAISGALVAVRHRLDLFGVLVLAFAAAAAGGGVPPSFSGEKKVFFGIGHMWPPRWALCILNIGFISWLLPPPVRVRG